MFLYKVYHEQEMNFPGRVITEVPVVVVIHQRVNHSPSIRVGPAEQQHPQWSDAREERTVCVVAGLDPGLGPGEDLTLHPVPWPGLATSTSTERPATAGTGHQVRPCSQTLQTYRPGPGVERPHHNTLLHHHHTALAKLLINKKVSRVVIF